MDNTIFKPEEQAIFALRSLYREKGYLPFKMTKFEEYDLYVRNKDFLVSDSIITFNDQSGRLLALKPDVTLSIIKNFREEEGCVEKVYYNENVYRLSASTHEYQEIPQTGLECIGNIDSLQILEVVTLAAQSLNALAKDWVLDLSHMGILSALLWEAGVDKASAKEMIRCLGEKNRHEMQALCEKEGVGDKATQKLLGLSEIYGDIPTVLSQLREICTEKNAKEALSELESLCSLLLNDPLSSHIHLDFSIVNDMKYYNGFVFRGYLPSIPEGILSGGQYDRMMEKFGKNAGGIGFALYLDLLERYQTPAYALDVDLLLLYDKTENPISVLSIAQELRRGGKRVLVSPVKPAKLICGEVLRYQNGRVSHVAGS